MNKKYHLCCNCCKGRWEIMDRQNNIIHWGDLKAMEILIKIMNEEK